MVNEMENGVWRDDMTKEGYTHIIVPMELHDILKERAGGCNTSISKYITELIKKEEPSKEFRSPFRRDPWVQIPPPALKEPYRNVIYANDTSKVINTI